MNVTSKFEGVDVSRLHFQTHEVPLARQDSSLVIEFSPTNPNADNFVLLMSHEKMPIYSKFDLGVMAESLPRDTLEGFRRWYLDYDTVRNRTGRWFINVMQVKASLFDASLLLNQSFDRELVDNFTSDYSIRTHSGGCYFFDKKMGAWSGKGLKVNKSIDLVFLSFFG